MDTLSYLLHLQTPTSTQAISNWYWKIDESLINSVLFLDLKKSLRYRWLQHNVVKKLQPNGAVQWPKSYLLNRSQSIMSLELCRTTFISAVGSSRICTWTRVVFLLCKWPSKNASYHQNTWVLFSLTIPQLLKKLNKDLNGVQKWRQSSRDTWSVK